MFPFLLKDVATLPSKMLTF